MTSSDSNSTNNRRSQGKKWHFLKKESGLVQVVYDHNKAVVLSANQADPGRVLSIQTSGKPDSKVIIKYSTGRRILFNLEYFTPFDDSAKRLYKVINDKSKFIQLASEIYGIHVVEVAETTSPCSIQAVSSKRPHSNSSSTPSLSPISPKRVSTGCTDGAEVQPFTSSTDSELIEDDEMKRYLITTDLVPVKVLVANLTEPREDFLLREIDEVFVEGLANEFKDNRSLFVKPLTAVVTGLKSPSDYDSNILDSYKLEVVGGNHRRAALKQLYERTQDDAYKWVNVLLFSEMPKSVVLKLASRHNRQDSYCHIMTTQDKVKLCHRILIQDFQGNKSAEWRRQCSDILSASKESLDFVFLLSSLEQDSYKELVEVFEGFSLLKLKGQQPSKRQTQDAINGVQQKPSIAGSAFKCLRGLPNQVIKELLLEVKSCNISFKEMRQQCDHWKNTKTLKTEFMKLAGVKSWEDVEKRFPLWSTKTKLEPFVKEVKNGKIPDSFRSFVQRSLVACSSNSDSADSEAITRNGLVYTAKVSRDWKIPSSAFENIKFAGADLILLHDVEEWTHESVSTILRAVSGINTRQKLEKYTVIVRKPLLNLAECTPNGQEECLYVAMSNKAIKAGFTLTKAIEVVKVIFVGKPHVKCFDYIVADNEDHMMQLLVKNFLPSGGTALEVGLNTESMGMLKACVDQEGSLISFVKDEGLRTLFLDRARMEVTVANDEISDD